MKFARETIDDFFRDLRAKGVDLDRDMLWGLFFIGKTRDAVEALVPELESRGYAFVDSWAGDRKWLVRRDWWLHVEIATTLSPRELHEMTIELGRLADERGLTFDGFDLGNVDGSVLHSRTD